MQSYFFVGGGKDGLNILAVDDGSQLAFHIPICSQHRLAILPICLLCDELSGA